MKQFNSEQEARQWVVRHVEEKMDDHCIDNVRFAFLDDDHGMLKYNAQKEDGCCGVFDTMVEVNGRLATVGCNWGH